MKKAFLLIILIGVLVSTQKPGFDYTTKNRAVAAVKVWDHADIDFTSLSSSLSEAAVIAKYQNLHLDCGAEPSPMGDRSCFTYVRSINGVDAWFVAFFFDKDHLNQVKVDFGSAGHKEILFTLLANHGEPRGFQPDQYGNNVIGWNLKNGILTTNEVAYAKGTTQIYWLSNEKLLGSMLKNIAI